MLDGGRAAARAGRAEVAGTRRRSRPCCADAVVGLRDTAPPAGRAARGGHCPAGATRRSPRTRCATCVTASPSLPAAGRARAAPWSAPGTRSSRAREGATLRPRDRRWASGTLRTAAERLPAIAAMGFDVVYLTPGPPDRRRRTARAATTRSTPGPSDPGSPVRDRLGRRRPRRDPPRPGHVRRLRRLRRRGPRARHGGRARPRAAVLARPPVGHRAPRVVHHRRRRHDRVRREPARRSTRTSTRSTSTTTPRASTPRSCRVLQVWIDHGVTLFRVDNPHTKPLDVLGVADRRRSRRPPRGDLPGRGVHPAGDDAHAGQGRLPPVATRTSPGATPRRSSSEYLTELSGEAGRLHASELLAHDARHPHRRTCSTAAPAAFKCARCWRPPLAPT